MEAAGGAVLGGCGERRNAGVILLERSGNWTAASEKSPMTPELSPFGENRIARIARTGRDGVAATHGTSKDGGVLAAAELTTNGEGDGQSAEMSMTEFLQFSEPAKVAKSTISTIRNRRAQETQSAENDERGRQIHVRVLVVVVVLRRDRKLSRMARIQSTLGERSVVYRPRGETAVFRVRR